MKDVMVEDLQVDIGYAQQCMLLKVIEWVWTLILGWREGKERRWKGRRGREREGRWERRREGRREGTQLIIKHICVTIIERSRPTNISTLPPSSSIRWYMSLMVSTFSSSWSRDHTESVPRCSCKTLMATSLLVCMSSDFSFCFGLKNERGT